MRVNGKSYLWGAVAPLRAANTVVRVNGKALVAVVCYIIDGKAKAVAEEDYDRPAAPVSPVVGYYLDILGYDGSIFFHAALNLDNDGVALARGHKHFFTLQLDFNRPARLDGEIGRTAFIVEKVDFPAESSADKSMMYSDFTGRYLEDFA